MKNQFYFFVSIFFFCQSIYAITPPIKYGKVSEEELLMTVYDKDSSAVAVVLCDYGFFDLRDYYFTRTIRVKILRKEGLYLANDIYPGIEGSEVKGKTFNLVDGEVVVTKLKAESVFRERVHEDYYRLRIAMPDVKVGSVFDIEMRQYFPPPVWSFQREIPVVWSELIMPESLYFKMQRRLTGFEPLVIRSRNRWAAKDVKAFKEEPYTNSSENYITKFDIDLESIEIPGVLYKEYATDWDAVARRLAESSWFGNHLESAALYLKDIVKEIEASDTTDLLKIQSAYNFVKQINWNGYNSIYTTKSSSLGRVIDEGIGNTADINLLLVRLLNKLDIKAKPVILSTRENGTISSYYPSLNRLNYVIAYVDLGLSELYLDATDELLPLGMLPKRCLNENAQLVHNGKAYYKSIEPVFKNKATELMTLNMNEDLSISGTYSSRREGYNAYNYRKQFEKYNSVESYIDNLEDNFSGLEISDYNIKNLEKVEEPISESCAIELEDAVFEVDGKVFFNPLFHLQMEENPFKLAERKYPVDYAYKQNLTYSISIVIPDGYAVEELPETIKMGLPENAASVFYSINAVGNRVAVTYRFIINKERFNVTDYQLLKEFYSQVIEKQAEPVILKKL